MERWSKKLLAIAFSFGLASVAQNSAVHAQEVKLPEFRSPIKQVADAQQQRLDSTLKRLRIALDKTAPIDARVKAVSELSGIEFDYLLANGEALVKAPPKVAQYAVSSIGGQIAMLHDHKAPGDHAAGSQDALSSYQSKVVRKSIKILRGALDHPDANVRNDAISILASRGDTKSLATVQELMDSGKLDQRKGIGYLSLAPAQIASPFIVKYVKAEKSAVKAAAVAQLAYNSTYTSLVKNIALAPNAAPEVVAAALPGLARSDDKFLEYGPALTQNPDLPNKVKQVALRETVNLLVASGADPSAARAIAPALKHASEKLGNPTALGIYGKLEKHYGLMK